MEVSRQLHVPAALPPCPSDGPKAVLDVEAKRYEVLAVVKIQVQDYSMWHSV
jgi:hypothetical protein